MHCLEKFTTLAVAKCNAIVKLIKGFYIRSQLYSEGLDVLEILNETTSWIEEKMGKGEWRKGSYKKNCKFELKLHIHTFYRIE